MGNFQTSHVPVQHGGIAPKPAPDVSALLLKKVYNKKWN